MRLRFHLLAGLLLGSCGVALAQSAPSVSPDGAFEVRVKPAPPALEIYSKDGGTAVLDDQLTGSQSTQILWSADSRYAIAFVQFGRATGISVAYSPDRKTWKIVHGPEVKAQIAFMGPRVNDVQCEHHVPAEWIDSHRLGMRYSVMNRDGTKAEYSYALVFDGDVIRAVDWK